MADNSHGRILQIDLQSGTVVKLPLSVTQPTGLAFDKSKLTFFILILQKKPFYQQRCMEKITKYSTQQVHATRLVYSNIMHSGCV